MVKFKLPKAPADLAWYAVSSPERVATINSVTVAPNATATNLTVFNPQVADDGFQIAFLLGGGTDGASYILILDYQTAGGSRLVREVGLDVSSQS